MAFPLLDQSEEDALHLTRLLNVEERPFARVSKRLLGRDALIRSFPTQLPTPPPDEPTTDEAAASVEAERQKQEQERRQWREDVMLDFAALESTFIRIQFLKNSNEQERERYAAEKVKILETAQAVRDNTAELRVQLEEAQRTLALRKEYDVQADKITSNRMLKPREEQHAQLEKLNAEIAELEQEGNEYVQIWAERKDQFDRILAEGRQMMRVIRGEKDEPEKEETMDDAEEAEGADDRQSKGENSRLGTPRPDMRGGATPLPSGHEDSWAPSSQAKPDNKGLGVTTPLLEASSAPSPANVEDGVAMDKMQDTEMGGSEATPKTAPISELEEGEAAEDSAEEGEHMDVT
ncbi:hypothetical protein MBLNU459_g4475t1 [Dothideomycetes sp. NU459]